MSIKSSVFYFPLGDDGLHLFRSMHDGWLYLTLGDVQLWPPARAMNRKTGKIGRWRWDRFYYHEPKPTTVCSCWRCALLERVK